MHSGHLLAICQRRAFGGGERLWSAFMIDANSRHATLRGAFAGFVLQLEFPCHRAVADLGDGELHFDAIAELEGLGKIAIHIHPRPAAERAIEYQYAARFEKGMLGLLHIAQDVREMHPPAGIGVGKCDLAMMSVKGRIHDHSNRLISTEALWPPKPKLLLSATLTSASRATFGTQSRSHSGS